MRYRSKPIECEASQWLQSHGSPGLIVNWVNANGGEARFEPEHVPVPTGCDCGNCGLEPGHGQRIVVRTIKGWAYAAPGHFIVMGETWFHPHGAPLGDLDERTREHRRDFYPCDPETFERRWEPVP